MEARAITGPSLASRLSSVSTEQFEIHEARRNAQLVLSLAAHYQRHPWHWRQQTWTPRDIVEHLETGQISFDLSLATDTANYGLLKGGWASDNCIICGWRLFESTIESHGTARTNGRDWRCTECYEKLFANSKPSPPPHPDIT